MSIGNGAFGSNAYGGFVFGQIHEAASFNLPYVTDVGDVPVTQSRVFDKSLTIKK